MIKLVCCVITANVHALHVKLARNLMEDPKIQAVEVLVVAGIV